MIENQYKSPINQRLKNQINVKKNSKNSCYNFTNISITNI